ncbi:hypothetical protein [Nitrosopumilus sp.]|uniref:hypothetical protein n=1 Tax=Nitrosopumilus sp. TaxID=2024843 RepID=UPI00292CCFB6|nr:hypothetical protein [Nitrosopumilus sp.]
MKITIDDKFDYFEIKLGIKEKIASFHGLFERMPISKVKSASNDISERSWKDMKNLGWICQNSEPVRLRLLGDMNSGTLVLKKSQTI